jgi:hypothetical protein
MAVSREDLLDWLETLPKSTAIAVDEDGLMLVTIDQEAYLEVGGIPKEQDHADDDDEDDHDHEEE